MNTTAVSARPARRGLTGATIAGGASESAVGGDAPYTAKAQHALTLFAHLQANMRTSTPPPPSELEAQETAGARAASATLHRTTDVSSHKHMLNTHSPLNSSTPSVIRSADAARLSSLHGLQRISSSGKVDEGAALQVYTDSELESLTPAQLRHQLRVAAAVTHRLHQRSRRLENEVNAWRHKYSELEAKVVGVRDAGGKEGIAKDRPAPSAPEPDGADSSRPTVTSSASQVTTPATASDEVAAARLRQLEAEVKRLKAHKEGLAKRLYAAEKTAQELREGLCVGAAASPAASSPSSSPLGAAHATARESDPDKHQPEACKSGVEAASPSQRDAEPESEKSGGCRDGTARGDAAGEDSVTHLRDTVRQLQRRLDLSEARTREAMQVHLDAVLLHCQSTPSAVALVNTEVRKLFQLMQQQILLNAVQHEAERARMNELLYQLQCQQQAP